MAVRCRLWVSRWLLASGCLALVPVASEAEGQRSERGRTSEAVQRTIAGTTVVGEVDRRTLQAALEALPRRPERIEVVDDASAPGSAHRARGLDGFVPIGSRVIYLRRQSATLRGAELEGGAYLLALAAVIWHEMAHAEGLDETQAQLREEALWQAFVRAGRVDSGVGLAYLADLKRRR